jgi:nucleotide-binding universal stress UspA family protein
MLQLKKILFPVDFSESCAGAAAYVAAFAGRFQSELTLLHVVDFGKYVSTGPGLWSVQPVDISQEASNWARETISTYRAEDFKQLNVIRQVVQGYPADQIVSGAKQSGTDLIMMPSHGLSAFRRYILGSVTAKVLHDAECAVWTGVHLDGAPPLDAIRFRKVLCAVDLGPQSERALRWAAAFSGEHSAELIVVHAVPAAEVRPYKYFDQPLVTVLENQGRKELQELLEALGITARVIVAGGEPAKVVKEIAQAESVDQLVIARGAAADGFGRLRTHAYALIRSAPCPVVSV